MGQGSYVLEVTPHNPGSPAVRIEVREDAATSVATTARSARHPLGERIYPAGVKSEGAFLEVKGTETPRHSRAQTWLQVSISVTDEREGTVRLDREGRFEASFLFVDPESPSTGVPMSGFTPEDVEVTGGTRDAAFSYSDDLGYRYRLRVQPDADAEAVTLRVGDAVAAARSNDEGGQRPAQHTVRQHRDAPLTVELSTRAQAPVSGPVESDIRFSEPTTGYG